MFTVKEKLACFTAKQELVGFGFGFGLVFGFGFGLVSGFVWGFFCWLFLNAKRKILCCIQMPCFLVFKIASWFLNFKKPCSRQNQGLLLQSYSLASLL